MVQRMRPRSDSSIAGKVRKTIAEGGPGKLWTFTDFRPFPPFAIAATLSRLAKEGTVRRVRRGVYYSPKATRFGELHPDPNEVAAAVFKNRGIEWKPSGPAAYNGLGLTTQVSPVLTLDVPKKIYSLKTGSGKTHQAIKLYLRMSRAVSGLSDKERVILDALRELRRIPGTSPSEAVSKIKDLLVTGEHSFNRLAARAQGEPPRVRALLGAIGTEVGASRRVLVTLRKSLNPTTTFHIRVGNALPSAPKWQIR